MKKVIIIASAILIFILIMLISLSGKKSTSKIDQKQLLTPTLTQVNFNNQLNKPTDQQNVQIVNKALPLTPFESEDFKFDYSLTLNRLVVIEKTPQAKEKFNQWALDNGLSELIANPNQIIFNSSVNQENINENQNLNVSLTPTPSINPIIDLLNIFLNYGKGVEELNSNVNNQLSNNIIPSTQQSQINPNQKNKITNNNQSFIYYAQCNSPYASLPMAEGCTVCNTGCGPTTVAMIASSYVNKSYDPKKIIDLYKEKGYYLSCSGTRYSDAKALLQSLGLKTTDYIIFDLEPADKVIDDLKKYYESGWTFMALANFKDEGPGHFFWITEIDDKGNLWAYDVYYGRFEAPPINENSRYPFPKYRVAFGVKK